MRGTRLFTTALCVMGCLSGNTVEFVFTIIRERVQEVTIHGYGNERKLLGTSACGP